jgi:hypothetical protein
MNDSVIVMDVKSTPELQTFFHLPSLRISSRHLLCKLHLLHLITIRYIYSRFIYFLNIKMNSRPWMGFPPQKGPRSGFFRPKTPFYAFFDELENMYPWFTLERKRLCKSLWNTPSVLNYVNHLPGAGCDVMMIDVISTNHSMWFSGLLVPDWSWWHTSS